jgi:hypothetical protein
VVSVALLELFETWLQDQCYYTPTTAWAYCRDITELTKALMAEAGGGEVKGHLADAAMALAFFEQYQDSPKCALQVRALQRWMEFLRCCGKPGARKVMEPLFAPQAAGQALQGL